MTELIWVLMLWTQIKAGTGYGYTVEVVGKYRTQEACMQVAKDVQAYAYADSASKSSVKALCIPSEL